MQTDINMRQCSESEEGIAESSPINICDNGEIVDATNHPGNGEERYVTLDIPNIPCPSVA